MKLKELLNNETFLSKYSDYEIVGNSYSAVRENDKLQLVFDIQKPKPKSVWDLKSGDKYFILYADGCVTEYEWRENGNISKGYRDHGNVFLTEEEANREVERRKVEALLLKHGGRRWYKKIGENFGFLIDNVDRFSILSLNQIQGTIYFDTEQQAQNAIDEIGADRIKKALFEVR